MVLLAVAAGGVDQPPRARAGADDGGHRPRVERARPRPQVRPRRARATRSARSARPSTSCSTRCATTIRAEQRLTSELAHELRTPLTAVQATAELMAHAHRPRRPAARGRRRRPRRVPGDGHDDDRSCSRSPAARSSGSPDGSTTGSVLADRRTRAASRRPARGRPARRPARRRARSRWSLRALAPRARQRPAGRRPGHPHLGPGPGAGLVTLRVHDDGPGRRPGRWSTGSSSPAPPTGWAPGAGWDSPSLAGSPAAPAATSCSCPATAAARPSSSTLPGPRPATQSGCGQQGHLTLAGMTDSMRTATARHRRPHLAQQGPRGHRLVLGDQDPLHDRGRVLRRLDQRDSSASAWSTRRCCSPPSSRSRARRAVAARPLRARPPTGWPWSWSASPARSTPTSSPTSSAYRSGSAPSVFSLLLAAVFAVWFARERHPVDPQHHHHAARGLLLARRAGDLRARHRDRRLDPRPHRLGPGRLGPAAAVADRDRLVAWRSGATRSCPSGSPTS